MHSSGTDSQKYSIKAQVRTPFLSVCQPVSGEGKVKQLCLPQIQCNAMQMCMYNVGILIFQVNFFCFWNSLIRSQPNCFAREKHDKPAKYGGIKKIIHAQKSSSSTTKTDHQSACQRLLQQRLIDTHRLNVRRKPALLRLPTTAHRATRLSVCG